MAYRKFSQLQKTARGSAVLGLLRIEQDGAYAALLSHHGASQKSNEHASDTADYEPSSSGDEGLASQATTFSAKAKHSGPEARETTWLVSGVTRWRRQLDAIISNLLMGDRSADDLDAAVRQVWRALH